jgi:hypothetical protein
LDDRNLASIAHDHCYIGLSLQPLDPKELAEIIALDHSYAKPADSPQIIVLRPRIISFVIMLNDEKYEFEVNYLIPFV